MVCGLAWERYVPWGDVWKSLRSRAGFCDLEKCRSICSVPRSLDIRVVRV